MYLSIQASKEFICSEDTLIDIENDMKSSHNFIDIGEYIKP